MFTEESSEIIRIRYIGVKCGQVFVHTEELGLSADRRKEMLPQENYFHLKLGQSSFSMKTDARI